MLLITTSRKPCMNSRKLAQALARLLGGVHMARGKKNVYGLIDEARRAGAGRVLVVTDFKGNPGRLEFLRVTANDWEWLEPLRVRGVFLPEKAKALPAFAGVRLAGPLKQKIADAFGIEEDEEAELVLEAGGEGLTFKNRKVFLQIRTF